MSCRGLLALVLPLVPGLVRAQGSYAAERAAMVRTQIDSTSLGSPRSPARKPVVVKMPVPTMFEITSAVALTIPSCRSKAAGLALSPPNCLIAEVLSGTSVIVS